jgi:hypothetical protein
MIKYAVAVAVAVGFFGAIPAGAEELGVGVGRNGVTVGEVHGDRDRDRDHYRDRDRDRRGHDETVIIKKDHDRDHDRRPVVIDRD